MADTELCTKCGATRDREGYPKWCKACHKAYKDEREDLILAREEKKGFAAGVRQTKETLAAEFERLGSGSFDGYEIAGLIRQAPGPLLDN